MTSLQGQYRAHHPASVTKPERRRHASQLNRNLPFDHWFRCPLDRDIRILRQAGNVRTVADPRGHTTTYSYSGTCAYALPDSITNAKSQTTSFSYDCNLGKPTAVTDIAGNTTSSLYDSLDRLQRIYTARRRRIRTDEFQLSQPDCDQCQSGSEQPGETGHWQAPRKETTFGRTVLSTSPGGLTTTTDYDPGSGGYA